jgi:endonuclease/exonuclease/phosphatase (EEP) superfamily protein YafD
MKNRLANLIEVVAFLSMAVALLGLFGKWHFALDLASHFRVQAVFSLIVTSPILLYLHRRWWASASGVVGLALLASWWPFLLPGSTTTSARYRLITMNVLKINSRHDLVIQCILENDPDFILLQETNSQWIDSLDAALGTTWPYHQCQPRSDNFGIALYSKMPWTECDVVEYSSSLPTPSIKACFRLPDGSDLRLIATHLMPPMNHAGWNARNAAFSAIAEDVRKNDPQRTVVAGDLNCSPWSYWFQRMIRESQLGNSANGHGLNITWMPIPIAVCGLPIDHVLVGSDIQVSRRSVGPYVGSDHRPVIVDFE